MCITTESSNKSASKINEEDENEVNFRIYSVISYFFVLVILGMPIWWYTTRVYRANLPINQMFEKELKDRTNKQLGIPLSLEYDILISFVHPDPAGLDIQLSGQLVDLNLQPILTVLSPLATFVVKSQWLYLTELGAIPKKVQDHYALQENQLPHIISPLETKLWSHLSPRPSINLVVYFPHCSAPLYIYNDKNERLQTNAFLSPRWGGIYILNANKNACKEKRFEPELQPIISTFVTQLQLLFKINGTSEDDINKLKIRKVEEMLDSTRRTLKSLAQLLSEINSIVISDEVGEKINIAVENADLAEILLKNDDINNALEHAKVAFSNSESAFSDPSLLALLYFPQDQKYAVYIPLFLPIMIPVFMSLKQVKKWYSGGFTKKVKSD